MSLLGFRIYATRILVFLFLPVPWLFRALFRAFRWAVCWFPGIPTVARWKLVQTSFLNYEWKRYAFLQGKEVDDDRLVAIRRESGRRLQATEATLPGSFRLVDTPLGIVAIGRVRRPVDGNLSLEVDEKLLRPIRLGKKGRFKVDIKVTALTRFPAQSRIRIVDGGGRIVPFRHSYAEAQLIVPCGDGSLFDRLEEGRILNKKGRIAAHSERQSVVQQDLLDFYQEAREFFAQEFELDLVLTYGTLLGCIREKNFIQNDDDFDAGYVSAHSDPKSVRKESLEIMRVLIEHGYTVSVSSTGRLFKLYKRPGRHLDIMAIWFEGQNMVGYRGISIPATREDFLPAREEKMGKQTVLVPHMAESFLEGYYGANWRTPNPSYVSTSGQTGIQLDKNYRRFLLPPRTYFSLRRQFRKSDLPGRLVASSVEENF